jgi:hypothetical protein
MAGDKTVAPIPSKLTSQPFVHDTFYWRIERVNPVEWLFGFSFCSEARKAL